MPLQFSTVRDNSGRSFCLTNREEVEPWGRGHLAQPTEDFLQSSQSLDSSPKRDPFAAKTGLILRRSLGRRGLCQSERETENPCADEALGVRHSLIRPESG